MTTAIPTIKILNNKKLRATTQKVIYNRKKKYIGLIKITSRFKFLQNFKHYLRYLKIFINFSLLKLILAISQKNI